MVMPCSGASAAAACQAGDDDVEDGGDAVDDGAEDLSYAVHDGHEAVPDGAENPFDLLGGWISGALSEWEVEVCVGVGQES